MNISKLVRDPLIHFLLIGGIVFLAYSMRVENAPENENNYQIQISDEMVDGIRGLLEDQLGRQPSEEELMAEIQPHINLEALYREGMALGLDQNDEQVRQRVAQKMLFLTEDLAEPTPATDDNLQAFMDAGDFRVPAKIDFEHLFFTPTRERSREQLITEATAILPQIRNGADPATFTAISPLASNRYILADEYLVARAFGAGRFSEVVFTLPTDNIWYGPFESKFGIHLARVSQIIPANENPTLDQLRQEVTDAFVEQNRLKANEAALRELVGQYDIEIQLSPATE